MPRRHQDQDSEEPPRKKDCRLTDHDRVNIETGEILYDSGGKQWKLGKRIGLGGFGVIHEVKADKKSEHGKYVVKVESHSSGPLFVEINCYLRIAKQEMIEEWKKEKGLASLGMPNYVASGSHVSKDEKYRFLILPRYKKNLEAILQEKKTFNLKTVLLIAKQILNILEYIHSKGYIHSDIKAANIMLDQTEVKNKTEHQYQLSNYSKSPVSPMKSKYPKWRTCRARKLTRQKTVYSIRKLKLIDYNEDLSSILEIGETEDVEVKKSGNQSEQLYLIDFGLASKYRLSSGQHKKCEDERKAHAGTLLFCSRDAHKGIQSRRSDLESLAYNMVYWLTGSLPWIDDIDDPEMIQRKKRHCFKDVLGFLHFCTFDPPKVLKELFQYINNLDVQDTPDYAKCQQFIKKALKENDYQDDGKFDFNNVEGWSLVKKKGIKMSESRVIVSEFKRPPLLSNMPIKPVLRKKIKSKKLRAALYFSKMLSDPEVLLKKVNKKSVENGEPPPPCLDLVLENLNPTAAMRDVYQKHLERKGKSPREYHYDYSGNSPKGFTPEMVAIWTKMLEERALMEAVKSNNKKVVKKKKVSKRSTTNGKRIQSLKLKATTKPHRPYSLRG